MSDTVPPLKTAIIVGREGAVPIVSSESSPAVEGVKISQRLAPPTAQSAGSVRSVLECVFAKSCDPGIPKLSGVKATRAGEWLVCSDGEPGPGNIAATSARLLPGTDPGWLTLSRVASPLEVAIAPFETSTL